MKFSVIALLIIIVCLPLKAQKTLFKANTFSVESDRVIQNGYEAIAKSREEIVSSYQSSYRISTSNELVFKLSINGLDNEGGHGQDHHLIIKPEKGKFTSPVFIFGQSDPTGAGGKSENLSEDADVLIRVDMRNVLNEFKSKGYYETFDGNKIYEKEFKGFYIAGGTAPLTWDFESLINNPQYKLADKEGTGIFEIAIHLNKSQFPGQRADKWIDWKLSKDISKYPSYKSPDLLVDALYNKAMEEMLLNIRQDGAFMAGAKWTGIWTRDISYSIILSLAIVNPDASKTSLMAKVKNERIIQDTGTGGAWPVSSDRLVWAIAAWEIYLSTGDKEWLKTSYKIIKNSAEDDIKTVYDESTGLFKGESSFLDWREQTYPRWMDPKDIFSSENLGTNAVHYKTFKILAEMSKLLNESPQKYEKMASKLKDAINKCLWIKDKGYYGQYLYGRNFLSLSPRSEALGEALCVLYGITSDKIGKEIISKTPVTEYGITCIYPQIPGLPPYHNDAIWPFVESYWAWASAKTGNAQAVSSALGSVYRAAALFSTNKENFVASTGDYLGTEINSDRQLWSVAGNLALTYRVIFGITLEPESISFSPFIPKEYNGERTLSNFKFRNSTLSITINGFGNKFKSITLDGKEIKGNKIPAGLNGGHKIFIKMNNSEGKASQVNLVENHFAPETPVIKLTGKKISWDKINGASEYFVYKNGKIITKTKSEDFELNDKNSFGIYQVMAVDGNGLQSFLSEPYNISAFDNYITVQAEAGNKNAENKYVGFGGTGYITLDKNKMRDQKVIFNVNVIKDGIYGIDFKYANGNGPLNTDNKCAIRTLTVDGKRTGAVIFAQRGVDAWTDWGYTNSFMKKLSKGSHTFVISFERSDNNMNLDINTALLDSIRLIKVN